MSFGGRCHGWRHAGTIGGATPAPSEAPRRHHRRHHAGTIGGATPAPSEAPTPGHTYPPPPAVGLDLTPRRDRSHGPVPADRAGTSRRPGPGSSSGRAGRHSMKGLGFRIRWQAKPEHEESTRMKPPIVVNISRLHRETSAVVAEAERSDRPLFVTQFAGVVAVLLPRPMYDRLLRAAERGASGEGRRDGSSCEGRRDGSSCEGGGTGVLRGGGRVVRRRARSRRDPGGPVAGSSGSLRTLAARYAVPDRLGHIGRLGVGRLPHGGWG